MSYVGRVSAANAEHFVASTAYGVCGTAAGTAAKVVVMEDFDTLLTGITIQVLFQNSNTAANATLNVNNTGAKPIYIAGIASPGTTAAGSWHANSIISFTYDGSAWRMNDVKGSVGVTVTAAAGAWSSATPSTQTISISGLRAFDNIVFGLSGTATAEQYDASVKGEIICTGQANGNITLTCYGAEPLVDIPYSVVILP